LDGAAENKSVYFGSDFLKVKPARNPYVNWKKTKKGVRIFINEKKIDLDKVGTTVWEVCNGENTVEDIAQILHEKYNMTMSEAERSLSVYFEQLVKKGLVVLLMPEETQARVEELSERPPYAEMLSASDRFVVFCGYCGAQNSRISNYCLRCGQKLVK
jgi:hypothetical protein